MNIRGQLQYEANIFSNALCLGAGTAIIIARLSAVCGVIEEATMSLLNDLLSTVLGSSQTLSEKSGTSQNQVESVVSAALPMLLQSMANNASEEKGEASLATALSDHAKVQASPEEQIKNADQEDGSKILSYLLGGNKNAVEDKLAESTGVTSSQVNSILSSLAPMLLNQVGSQVGSQKQKGEGSNGLVDILTGLVTGKSGGNAGGSSGGLGSILNFAMQDNDGDGKSDILSALTGLLTGK